MFITTGHFLSPYTKAYDEGGNIIGRLQAVDTDLMVGMRLVGFDPETGEANLDLVKVSKIVFSDIPEPLGDMLPEGFTNQITRG